MKIKEFVSVVLTKISPELNTRILYYYKYGRRINLKDPTEFHEKLLWLKIYRYNNDPIVRQCADKWRVREYVTAKTGGATLNELYGVYDNPEEIDWNALPESFVIKCNIGSGNNIIVPDKSLTDYNATLDQIRTWDIKGAGVAHAEMHYQGVAEKIIIEKYLGTHDGKVPEDYKLYCFNGKVLAILYMTGRFTDHAANAFYDSEWNYLGVPIQGAGKYIERGIDLQNLPSRPESLDEMIHTAEQLSQDFPFVRIDFYDINGRAVFGEMTFTPAGGFDTSAIPINGKDMGAYIIL